MQTGRRSEVLQREQPKFSGGPFSSQPAPVDGPEQLNHALRASEFRFRHVIETLPAAVYLCDRDGRVTLFNEAAVDLWGRAPQIGKDQWCGSWRIYWPDGGAMPLDECPMAVALREGRRVRGVEIIVERPDGTRRNVLPHPDPIRDEQGNVVGAINMLVDITQRKKDEQDLQHANHELRRRNDEMAQFVYTISHDLKSPVVTTMGFVGMIREDLAAGRVQEIGASVCHIERAMSHLNELIDDLLHLGRAGRTELSVSPIDLNEIAQTLGAQVQPQLSAAGASLRVQPGMPTVHADRRGLMQILENLLANAIKYGRRPKLRVNIGAVEMDDELRVFVQDNGVGIPSQYHKRIFGLFQRLDCEQEGTGVGLAIVARVMELHAGRAWVESMPDHGATFWLAFPRRPSIDGAASTTA